MEIFFIGMLILVVFAVRVSGILSPSHEYNLGNAPRYFRSFPEQSRMYLRQHSDYYNKLDAKNKSRFEKRVKRFIDVKEFIPRGIKVTEEMKVLVAASAIQIGFGYPRVYFSYFKRILIYPDDYYSRITRKYHQGEVNTRFGMVVLSWKNLKYGVLDKNDGRHLGLHEMAHVLKLENRIRNDEYGFIKNSAWKEYVEVRDRDMQLAKSRDTNFLRDSAYRNVHEFFAVSVESFFERTEDLKKEKPELYHVMTKVLNQDPLVLWN